MKYRHIIWDWNGTLLNDTWLCVELTQKMLGERGLVIPSIEEYRRKYHHPMRSFYQALGANFELYSFEETADLFHALYSERVLECALHDGASAALEMVLRAGIRQSILSALPHNILVSSVDRFGIGHYFVEIRGLDSNHADSKVNNGKEWMTRRSFPAEEIVLIGDTSHDHEVATALGIDCLLIGSGFQHQDVLAKLGRPFFQNIDMAISYLV